MTVQTSVYIADMENRHKATLCGIGFMPAFFANKRAQNYAENLDMCDFCIHTWIYLYLIYSYRTRDNDGQEACKPTKGASSLLCVGLQAFLRPAPPVAFPESSK